VHFSVFRSLPIITGGDFFFCPDALRRGEDSFLFHDALRRRADFSVYRRSEDFSIYHRSEDFDLSLSCKIHTVFMICRAYKTKLLTTGISRTSNSCHRPLELSGTDIRLLLNWLRTRPRVTLFGNLNSILGYSQSVMLYVATCRG